MSTHAIIRIAASVACLLLPGVRGWSADGPDDAGRSRRLREAIRAGLPRYAPKLDNDATMADSGEQAVEKDGVLTLPTVRVKARSRGLDPEAVITSLARLEQALKNAPGDKIGNLFGLNNGHAIAILREEMQLKEFNDLKRRASQISLGDSPENRELKRLVEETTTRTPAYWMRSRSGR